MQGFWQGREGKLAAGSQQDFPVFSNKQTNKQQFMEERKSGGPLEMKDSCLSEPKETDGLRLKKREEGKIPPERGRREMTVGWGGLP